MQKCLTDNPTAAQPTAEQALNRASCELGLNLKRTDGKGFGSGKTTDDMTVEDYDVTYGMGTDIDGTSFSLLAKGMLLNFNISNHIGHLIDKGVDIFDITKNMLKTTKSKDVQKRVETNNNKNHNIALPWIDTDTSIKNTNKWYSVQGVINSDESVYYLKGKDTVLRGKPLKNKK